MRKILMVCLGNICRSPMAEGIFRHQIKQMNLDNLFEFDSAGTSGDHIGEYPDNRSIAIADKFGIVLTHRARQFTHDDYANFDQILVMDKNNFKDVKAMAQNKYEIFKIKLITDFDLRSEKPSVVADPFYGNERDFLRTYQHLLHCFEGWIKTLHF